MFKRFFIACLLFLSLAISVVQAQTAEIEITISIPANSFADQITWRLNDSSSMLVQNGGASAYPTFTVSNFTDVVRIMINCGELYTFSISEGFGVGINPPGGYQVLDITNGAPLVPFEAFEPVPSGQSQEEIRSFSILCSSSSGHEDQQNGGTPLATQTTLSFTSTSAHKTLINRLMRCRSDDVLDEEERRRRISSGEELDELDACPSFEDYPEQPRWNLWVNAGYTVVDGSSSSPDGGILNGVVGLDYKVNEDWVLGALAGYEWTDFDFARTNGTLEGGGFTLAAYSGLRISRNLTIDALLGHSWLNYDNDVAGDSGDFDATRWMLAGNITGHFLYGKYTIEPNLHGQIAWESQEGYVTSGGTVVSKQSLTIGKVAFGPRVSRDHLMDNGTNAEFWGAIEGEYDFANNDSGTTNLNMDGDISARLSAGVDFDFTNEVSLELDGNIGGLGAAGYTTYQGNVRVALPF